MTFIPEPKSKRDLKELLALAQDGWINYAGIEMKTPISAQSGLKFVSYSELPSEDSQKFNYFEFAKQIRHLTKIAMTYRHIKRFPDTNYYRISKDLKFSMGMTRKYIDMLRVLGMIEVSQIKGKPRNAISIKTIDLNPFWDYKSVVHQHVQKNIFTKEDTEYSQKFLKILGICLAVEWLESPNPQSFWAKFRYHFPDLIDNSSVN